MGPARSAYRGIGAVAVLALLAALAGCAGPASQSGGGGRFQAYHRAYPPPGPPDDPWGPYIKQAAQRFRVPEQWIRAVMRQESGGREDAESSAGAMGLMQVIPSTYATLESRYGLGNDPYEPHDNIMAGTAYIREMYDRFGAPGFLAAYNAGPDRLDSYLSGGTPLPDETVGYLSNIAPRLGPGTRLSGPLAVYAGGAGGSSVPYAPPVMVARAHASGCDPDAAFDPDHPCTPARLPVAPAPVMVASSVYVPPAPARQAIPGYCDPDAAYDPDRVCAPPPIRTPVYVPAPEPRGNVRLASLSVAPRPAGSWAIQVGAFLDPAVAREAASKARHSAPDLLAAAGVDLPPTTPFGGAVLYRARLVSLTPDSAAQACARLVEQGDACMTVPPGR